MRVWIDNEIVRVDAEPRMKRLGARVQVIQDRIVINPDNRARLVEAIEIALRFGKGKSISLSGQRTNPQLKNFLSPPAGIARIAILIFARRLRPVQFQQPARRLS